MWKSSSGKCLIYNRGNSKHNVFLPADKQRKHGRQKMEGKKEKKRKNSGVTVAPVLQGQLLQKEEKGFVFPNKKISHRRPPTDSRIKESRAKNGSAKKFAQWAHIPFPHPERQSARRKMALPSLSHILPSPSPQSPNPLSCTLHSRGEITNKLKCSFTHTFNSSDVQDAK